MRIAVACHNAAHIGGVETYLDAVVPALVGRGHQVGVWFESGTPVESRIARLKVSTSWAAEHHGDCAISLLRAWTPDLLFVHGVQSPALEARLLDIAPGVFFAHSYYGTCISGSKMHAAPSSVPCTRRFGPACIGLFYPRRCGGWSPLTMLRQYGVQSDRLKLLARYRHIVIASEHMAAEYARHGLAAKTHVVPLPATNAGTVAARTADPAVWRLLYLGRLERTKGADIALEASARAAGVLERPVILRIAGAGSLERTLRQRAQELTARFPRLTVQFPGWLDSLRRAEVFDASDLLLIPSRWPEPFGLVGLEAGLHGVPCVAFDVGGIREWLQSDTNGWLVEPGTRGVARFASAIADALNDPVRLEGLRRRATAAAREATIDGHVRRLEPVLAAAAASFPVAV
jgi:glycosyltransferase involved in cell wall biosynthesis